MRYNAELRSSLSAVHKIEQYNSLTREITKTGKINFTPIIEKDINKCVRSKIFFVLLFSFDDCSTCLKQELNKFNQITKEGEVATVGIYYRNLGPNINYVKRHFGIKFETFYGDSSSLLVNNPKFKLRKIKDEPIVLVLNSKTKRILDSYIPIPGNLKRRNYFYLKWENILYLIN